jgi:DNA polymerase delta subunit 1
MSSIVVSVQELIHATRTVYDIETTAGTFTTASGIVLKNTDSIYCIFDVGIPIQDPRYMEAIFEMSERAAEAVSALFVKPVHLEFEKAMRPLMLFSKKRYAYIPYTSPHTKGAMEVKGLAMVRRDTCPFARAILTKTVSAIMDTSVHEGLKEATEGIRCLLDGEAPVHELVLTKSLRSEYAAATLPAHAMLAERIKERSPSCYPRPGDRVPYLLVCDSQGRSPKLLRDGIEDPAYVQTNGITIDHESYYKRQMATPLVELFTICGSSDVFAANIVAIKRRLEKQKSAAAFLRMFFPARAGV